MSCVLSSIQVCTSNPFHYRRGISPPSWENTKMGNYHKCEGPVLYKWILTGSGRRTGSASPPASPLGHPAGSYGYTALARTGFLSLQQENTHNLKSLWVPETSRGVCNTMTHPVGAAEREAGSSMSLLWRGWVSKRQRDTNEKQRRGNREGKWLRVGWIDRQRFMLSFTAADGSCTNGSDSSVKANESRASQTITWFEHFTGTQITNCWIFSHFTASTPPKLVGALHNFIHYVACIGYTCSPCATSIC